MKQEERTCPICGTVFRTEQYNKICCTYRCNKKLTSLLRWKEPARLSRKDLYLRNKLINKLKRGQKI